MNRLFGRLAYFCASRRRAVLVVASLITLFCAYLTSRLPILTSRSALFPKDNPVQKKMEEFLQKFGSAADLILLIEGAPKEELEAFSSALAQRLSKLPTVRLVTERLDTDFFFSRSYLMVPTETLLDLEKRLDEVLSGPIEALTKIVSLEEVLDKVEEWLDNPPPLSPKGSDIRAAEEGLRIMNVLLEEWAKSVASEKGEIGFYRLSKYKDAERFLKGRGFLTSRDGSFYLVLVSRRNPSSEFSALGPFIKDVKKAIEEVRANWPNSRVKVGLTGLPAIEYEEYLAVQSDVALVVSVSAVLVVLVIVGWMRSLRRALVIFIPMAMGTLWNMAVVLGTVGHLTLLTAAFTAILFGLGVDYGIFLTSRIMEEVETAPSLEEAIARASEKSGKAILSAGGASVLVFMALIAVPFKGFSELGVVAGTGVLMIVLATFIVTPALYAAIMGGHIKMGEAPGPSRVYIALSRPLSAIVALGAALAAVLGGLVGINLPFDYNALSLLPKGSEAAALQRRLVKESDYQPEVLIFTAPNMEEARRITKEAKNNPFFSSVQSLTDLFPEDGEEKARVARKVGEIVEKSNINDVLERQGEARVSVDVAGRLRDLFNKAGSFVEDLEEQAFSGGHKGLVEALEALRNNLLRLAELVDKDKARFAERTEEFFNALLEAARRAAEVLLAWKEARPLTPSDLPPNLRERFFAEDGTVAIYVYPRFSVYDIGLLDRLMAEARAISEDVTGFPATHQAFSRLAALSFRVGSLLSILAALVVILVSVRAFRLFVVASLPLLMGAGFMLGLMNTFEVTFNYANIVGLPMVMALALDYGVWYASRLSEAQDPWLAASLSSRAIMLAAGTTVAGVGSILLGSYRGVSSMGLCILLGLISCLVTARLVAPAVAHLIGGGYERSKKDPGRGGSIGLRS